MKFIDFLKACNEDMFVVVGVDVCGMLFETKHSAWFYIDHGDNLTSKKIRKIYMKDDEVHVYLEC